jgi:hypothetical protein
MGKFDGTIALVRGLLPKTAGRGATKVAGPAAKGLGAGALGYGIYKGAESLGNALGGSSKSQSAANDNRRLTSRLGMAGTAGRQSFSSGGTMPDFSRSAAVSVSKNDNQKEILYTAVKLLASIDASMKAQIEQQRFINRQQILQSREAAQEYRSPDAVIAGKVESLRNTKTGSVLESTFKTALIGALGYGAFKMDEIDAESKDFMASLSDSFKKLGIAAIALGAGYAAIKGGVGAGAAMKAAQAAVAQAAAARTAANLARANRNKLIVGGKLTDLGEETLKLKNAYGLSTMAAHRMAKRIMPETSEGGIKAGMRRIAEVQAEVTAPKQNLLKEFAKKVGAGSLAGIGSKLGGWGGLLGVAIEALQYSNVPFVGGKEFTGRNIAGSVGSVIGGGLGFIGGLGLGSIPASIALGLAGNMAATSIYDFFAGNGSPDATQVGAKVDVERILSTIRTRESRGNYRIQSKSSSASGAYQFIDSTWRGLTKKYGIGTEYSRAYLAPPEVQDEVARRYVNDILRRSGGDVSKVPLEWYTGNINGAMSAEALAANNGLTPQAYQASWMQSYNDPSSATKGGGQYSAVSTSDTGMAKFQAMASKMVSNFKPTNLMTRKMEKVPSNNGSAAQNIQARAAAMETAQRSKTRAENQKAPPALTRASIAQNVAATSAGGAMNVPNPGYDNGQTNLIDYLVYFGLAA